MTEQKQAGDNLFTVLKFVIPMLIIAYLIIQKYIANISINGNMNDPKIVIQASQNDIDTSNKQIETSQQLKVDTPNLEAAILQDVINEDEVEQTDLSEDESLKKSENWLNGKWGMIIYQKELDKKITELHYRLNIESNDGNIIGNGDKFKDIFKGEKVNKYLIPCKIEGKTIGNTLSIELKEASSNGNATFITKIIIDKIKNNKLEMTGTFENDKRLGFLKLNKLE